MNDAPADSSLLTAIDVASLPALIETQPVSEIIVNSDTNGDFDQARDNLLEVVKTGMRAIETLNGIAEQSQHPRAFEVLANLMKTMMEAQQDLLALRKKKNDLGVQEGTPNKQSPQTVNHNNLFVGSTHELQKMLENVKNGKSGTNTS